MPNLHPANTPHPIRSQAEIIEDRFARQPEGSAHIPKLSEEERKRRKEIKAINSIPNRRKRRKARRGMYRTIYDMAKMKREVLTDVYPFKSKEEYYAKCAYRAAYNSILANPNVPHTQKQQTAKWHELPYYTRQAYAELIRATFALRDELTTKEKKLLSAARHIV